MADQYALFPSKEACHLYVDNQAFFECGHSAEGFEAQPLFITDSRTLAKYFHGNHFRAEGIPAQGGVTIRIFDTEEE